VADSLLTPAAVAERLATSTDHVLGLIHSGRLRAVNIGMGKVRPRWRVPAEALDEFKLSRTATAPTPRAARRKRATDVVEFYS
jgi:excisionase family DNA binding protein